MIWKDSFMKNDISGSENLFVIQGKKLVSLLTVRITKENTCLGSRLQFVPMSFEGRHIA